MFKRKILIYLGLGLLLTEPAATTRPVQDLSSSEALSVALTWMEKPFHPWIGARERRGRPAVWRPWRWHLEWIPLAAPDHGALSPWSFPLIVFSQGSPQEPSPSALEMQRARALTTQMQSLVEKLDLDAAYSLISDLWAGRITGLPAFSDLRLSFVAYVELEHYSRLLNDLHQNWLPYLASPEEMERAPAETAALLQKQFFALDGQDRVVAFLYLSKKTKAWLDDLRRSTLSSEQKRKQGMGVYVAYYVFGYALTTQLFETEIVRTDEKFDLGPIKSNWTKTQSELKEANQYMLGFRRSRQDILGIDEVLPVVGALEKANRYEYLSQFLMLNCSAAVGAYEKYASTLDHHPLLIRALIHFYDIDKEGALALFRSVATDRIRVDLLLTLQRESLSLKTVEDSKRYEKSSDEASRAVRTHPPLPQQQRLLAMIEDFREFLLLGTWDERPGSLLVQPQSKVPFKFYVDGPFSIRIGDVEWNFFRHARYGWSWAQLAPNFIQRGDMSFGMPSPRGQFYPEWDRFTNEISIRFYPYPIRPVVSFPPPVYSEVIPSGEIGPLVSRLFEMQQKHGSYDIFLDRTGSEVSDKKTASIHLHLEWDREGRLRHRISWTVTQNNRLIPKEGLADEWLPPVWRVALKMIEAYPVRLQANPPRSEALRREA